MYFPLGCRVSKWDLSSPFHGWLPPIRTYAYRPRPQCTCQILILTQERPNLWKTARVFFYGFVFTLFMLCALFLEKTEYIVASRELKYVVERLLFVYLPVWNAVGYTIYILNGTRIWYLLFPALIFLEHAENWTNSREICNFKHIFPWYWNTSICKFRVKPLFVKMDSLPPSVSWKRIHESYFSFCSSRAQLQITAFMKEG